MPLLVSGVLAGCANPPIKLSDKAASEFQVPFKKITVDDLGSDIKIQISDTVWVNGWVGGDDGFKPPLHTIFTSKLKNSLKATGQIGEVNIAVMRAGYFMETNMADSLAFVNMLIVYRDRAIKCDVDVNIKTEFRSDRKVFEHQIRRSIIEKDDETKQFLAECQADLVKQIAENITNKK